MTMDSEGTLVRRQALRTRLEERIETLIDALDEIDGDPDFEPSLGIPHDKLHLGVFTWADCDREPDPEENEASLGWTAAMSQVNLGRGSDEDEPSLGSVGSCGTADRASQSRWASGCGDDSEEQCEDEGNDIQAQPHDAEPDEPNLAAAENHHDQRHWSQGIDEDDDKRHDTAIVDRFRTDDVTAAALRARLQLGQLRWKGAISAPLPGYVGDLRVVGFAE